MRTLWLILIAVMALALAACNEQPPSGTLEYSTAFDGSIPPGQTLPGTDIKYIGKTDQGAQVTIGGQVALKRTLDSLTWSGEAVPGVNLDYNLRVTTFDAQSLNAVGTTQVTVSNPKPRAVAATTLPKGAAVFKGLVTYNVPLGKTIPGATITYDGKTPNGAKLGGIEGYAFRETADSIVWLGQLADKLWLELDLRLVSFDANGMQVTGTATLYLKP